ncbi:RimK family alpha-L-glutamate ligase [Patescibacteria group bacterium]
MNKKHFKLLVLPSVRNMQKVIDKFPFPVDLTKGQFNKLEIIFNKGDVTILYDGVDLREFSFVWLCSSWVSRDIAYAVQLYLDKNDIPNTPVEKSTSKLTDHMLLALNNITSPDTLFIKHKNVEKYLVQIENTCGYPVVVKDTKGSRGTHSIIAATEKELLEKIKELPGHKNYLFQRHIANEYDWGIMVANGVVVSGEKSYPCEGEFRNNACNGAKEVFIDLAEIPQQIKQMALDCSDAIDLDWSRSDIIIDKNTQEPYVLETNRFPGITPETSEVDGAYAFISSQVVSPVSALAK